MLLKCIWALAGVAVGASSAAAGVNSGRQVHALAEDDGCSEERGCGVGLLQHRADWPKMAWPVVATTTVAPPRAQELVHEVYTYGAPATHDVPFRNAASADGCFAGLRSYTEDLLGAWGEIHQVDAAAMNNYYPHAVTPSVCLHWGRDSYYTPCGAEPGLDGHPDWPQRGGQVYQEWRLHQEDDYTDRLDEVTVDGKKVADKEPFLTARMFVLLAFKSYDTSKNTKAAIAEKLDGWKLVKKVVDRQGQDTDPVMLVQHTKSLDCALVFAGTNDPGEMQTSTTNYRTGYCGFEGVHVGYRNELWTITGDVWPELRPSLEQCNRVTCVGHSLGGALCEIFAACANSGNVTDSDFQRLAWKPGKPALMPEWDLE
mmetsp:Transcript_62604/g.179583  ORF Transcript_62604/g.179583 Transcript_62604/m.179583 type:complete len:371 (-) Transcript_62604:84-1196(-)|eukprot:CAMPEP_0177231430 /NCGR_PEP_ID=MMETSP0367-20130122/42756_1 /TAXON_ID=447022 ORGANISM="Scrippsiella hangoei-like, Strain SHHI-4" /NCGR_SAMPLE_ID=MMETSP0367 /ASSEMBLY_ACC=CAM_ASM_000362 /LENGTH=370 /DNA_ID=CAMNT_0018681951 /DNA_START=105 /DNA_END=1217 /DNA_ORIENTATION=+